MPSQHAKRNRSFRPDDLDVYDRAKANAHATGSDIQAAINRFLRWLAGDTDELPQRPGKPPSGRD